MSTQPDITIDKDLPIPRRSTTREGYVKYPWRQMQVGDSFIFPDKGNPRRTMERAGSLTNYRKKAQGEAYVVRTVEEDGHKVVRVWRVA